MDIELWVVWAIFAAILVVGEIFTAGFFLLLFGVGAAVAAVLAYFKVDFAIQLGAFVVVSGALIPFSRKFAAMVTKESPERVGADRHVGKTAVVIEAIDPKAARGRVKVEGDEWRAESDDDSPVEEGKYVEVIRVTGTRLIVKEKEGGA